LLNKLAGIILFFVADELDIAPNFSAAAALTGL